MTDLNLMAQPLSRDKIERIAGAVRHFFGAEDPFFPVSHVLEWGLDKVAPGFTFEVRDAMQMGDRHGLVDTFERTLSLRDDVYDNLCAGRGRDRFTGTHELGHAILHGGPLNRLKPGVERKAYCDPEWQANEFAGAVLMPKTMVAQVRSVREMVNEFGVTEDAARVRLRNLKLQLPDE